MDDNYLVVLNTCPDADTAQALAEMLVQQKLAACVNIIPGIRSVYRWQGKIETGQEQLLVIKTTSSCYAALESALRQRHPYELPEIIALPITQGLPPYLAWLNDNVGE